MRLIEINDGVFVDAHQIEGVSKPDSTQKKTLVFTHHRKYATNFPFETIIALLKQGDTIDRDVSEKSTMKKLDAVLNKTGHFAG